MGFTSVEIGSVIILGLCIVGVCGKSVCVCMSCASGVSLYLKRAWENASWLN